MFDFKRAPLAAAGSVVAKFLYSYLIVTGIGTLIVIAMPGLVIIGFFLLVIPGLILSLLPTAFVYGLIFTIGWAFARTAVGDGLAIVAGIAAVAVVTFTAVLPTRMIDLATYRASLLDEVAPASQIAIKGHVRFDLRHPRLSASYVPGTLYTAGQAGFACKEWCLAALFTPGVTMVTIDKWSADGAASLEARSFWLDSRPGCTSKVVLDPDAIRSPLGNDYEDGKMLAAQWAIKLASEHCLVEMPAMQRPDFTIIERDSSTGNRPDDWSFGRGMLRTTTVEIFAETRLVHRAHQSILNTLASFLHAAPDGGMENFRFGWGRATVSSNGGHDAVSLLKSMSRHTNLAGKTEPGIARNKEVLLPGLRRQLDAALDDLSLNGQSPAFKVIEAYFDAVGKTATDDDVVRISRIVADQRLTRFPGMWHLKLPPEQAQTIYDAYTDRLIATGAPLEMRRSLIQQFVENQGASAIRLIGPKQEILLVDPVKRLAVREQVRALGHGAPANAQRLLAILRQHAALLAEIHRQRDNRQIGSYGRQDERDANIEMLGAAKSGLCLLGPKGKALRGELETFLVSGIMPPHLVDGHEMTDWWVILARMGKPIETMAKPQNMSGSEANYHRNIREKVAYVRPDRC